MKTLATLPIAALLLLPMGPLHAQICPPDEYGAPTATCSPAGGFEDEDAVDVETEDRDLGFGPEGPDEDLDLEGVTTDAEAPEIGINGFGGGR
ncbi:MAG: hypothetical protein AAGI44_05250 [Pseudomonadota bacterium]